MGKRRKKHINTDSYNVIRNVAPGNNPFGGKGGGFGGRIGGKRGGFIGGPGGIGGNGGFSSKSSKPKRSGLFGSKDVYVGGRSNRKYFTSRSNVYGALSQSLNERRFPPRNVPIKGILLVVAILAVIFLIAFVVNSCTSKANEEEQRQAQEQEQKVSPEEQQAILNSPSNDPSVSSTILGQGTLTNSGFGKASVIAVGDNIGTQQLINYAAECGKTEPGGPSNGVDAINRNSNDYNFKPLYTSLKDLISSYDVAFVNQETVAGGNVSEFAGYPDFNSPDTMIDALADTGFDVLAINSNHTMTMGAAGAKHMRGIFGNFSNVLPIGSYETAEDQAAIHMVARNGIKIAFLSYNYGVNGVDRNESSTSTNVTLLSDDRLQRDIANARKCADAVVVSVHWGDEYATELNEDQQHYGQLCADLGADVVLGTHTHVIQPLSWVNGSGGKRTLVAYSLGDFASGTARIDAALGGMLSFDFVRGDDGKVSVQNIQWRSTVEHLQNGQYSVQLLKGYSEEQAKANELFAQSSENNSEEQLANPLGWMRARTQAAVPAEFNPEY